MTREARGLPSVDLRRRTPPPLVKRILRPRPSTETVPEPARGKRSRLPTKTSSRRGPGRAPERASGQTLLLRVFSFFLSFFLPSRFTTPGRRKSKENALLPSFSLSLELGRVTRRRGSAVLGRERAALSRSESFGERRKRLRKRGSLRNDDLEKDLEKDESSSFFVWRGVRLPTHSSSSSPLSSSLFQPPLHPAPPPPRSGFASLSFSFRVAPRRLRACIVTSSHNESHKERTNRKKKKNGKWHSLSLTRLLPLPLQPWPPSPPFPSPARRSPSSSSSPAWPAWARCPF